MRGQKFVIILLIGIFTFTCNNVVIKNIKTGTVTVTKVHNLYEVGDTIFYEKAKSEIVRKRLRNGTILKKGPTIRVIEDKTVKKLLPSDKKQIPPPNLKK